MALWRLSPIDPNNDEWQTSSYKGEVIVRSMTEDDARRLAARTFAKSESAKCAGVAWRHEDVVAAERIEHRHYIPYGPDRVLTQPATYAPPTTLH